MNSAKRLSLRKAHVSWEEGDGMLFPLVFSQPETLGRGSPTLIPKGTHSGASCPCNLYLHICGEDRLFLGRPN